MNFFSQDYDLNISDIEETFKSYNPLQWIWNLRIGREKYFANPMFPVILGVSTYFITCALFMIVDFGGEKVKFLSKYKIQNDKVVTWPMVYRTLKRAFYNNLLLILPFTIAQFIWIPETPLPINAPGVYEFVWQSFVMLVLFDFQYWIWHTVHHKIRWLYRNFHSIHHQYHSTFSWTTQFLHPWELFTVGFFATVDGWFFKCHPLTYWGFMVLNIFASVEAHSGFDFPISLAKIIPFGIYGGTAKHDMHHIRPLTNFQPFFSTWDRIMGWECPGIKAGGTKTKELCEWERKNKSQRMHKHATELMKGKENGLLYPKECDDNEIQLKYD